MMKPHAVFSRWDCSVLALSSLIQVMATNPPNPDGLMHPVGLSRLEASPDVCRCAWRRLGLHLQTRRRGEVDEFMEKGKAGGGEGNREIRILRGAQMCWGWGGTTA